MIRFIHSSPKFEKRLNALRKSEKMAVAAARKADEIIQGLINSSGYRLSELGKLTRHGECRIKNSVKYDLGKGYRMFCVKEEEHLFLLYIGTHDDCSAWIENNRNFSPDTEKKNIISYAVKTTSGDPDTGRDLSEPQPDYEDLLMAKITERELKYIFRGLLGEKRRDSAVT